MNNGYRGPNFAYVRYLQTKDNKFVPITWIQYLNAHCDDDFDANKKYPIKRSLDDPIYYDGSILMLRS